MKLQSFLIVIALVAGELCAAEPPIIGLAFSPDGRQILAASQTGAQVFRWPSLQHERTIDVAFANLHCLAFSESGDRLAVGGGEPADLGIVEIREWPSGKKLASLEEHDDSVSAIQWVGNHRLLTASRDCMVKLWDLQQEPRLLKTFRGHSRSITDLLVLPGGKQFVSVGEDQSLRVWAIASGELIRSLSQHTKPINAIALSPAAGRLPLVATASADKTVRFWQPTIGRMVRYIRLDAQPLALAWLEQGERLAAACTDGSVKIIDPLNVEVLRERALVDGWAYAAEVPDDGNTLAVGGTGGALHRMRIGDGSAESPGAAKAQ